jgi:hypothetical protein
MASEWAAKAIADEEHESMVGEWHYGANLTYEINIFYGKLFYQEFSTEGDLFCQGELVVDGKYLVGQLRSPTREHVGTIRLQHQAKAGKIISNFQAPGTSTWNAATVATKEPLAAPAQSSLSGPGSQQRGPKKFLLEDPSLTTTQVPQTGKPTRGTNSPRLTPRLAAAAAEEPPPLSLSPIEFSHWPSSGPQAPILEGPIGLVRGAGLPGGMFRAETRHFALRPSRLDCYSNLQAMESGAAPSESFAISELENQLADGCVKTSMANEDIKLFFIDGSIAKTLPAAVKKAVAAARTTAPLAATLAKGKKRKLEESVKKAVPGAKRKASAKRKGGKQ